MKAVGIRYRLSVGQSIFKVFNVTFLAVLGLITLYPFYFMLIGSLAHPDTILTAYLWPKKFFYANYYFVISTPGILQAYMISVLRLATAVPGMLLVTSAAAFVLSRREMMFRTPIIIYFFITMFFSGGLIPYYLTIRTVGLYDTFWVYVIPSLFHVWSMIVMKTSIQTLPNGLVDAALIDGATFGRIFLRIILPLSKAMLAVLGLFAAVGAWNDWFTGLFYVQNTKLRPLQSFLLTLDIRRRVYLHSPYTYLLLYKDSPLYDELETLLFSNSDILGESLQRTYVMVSLIPIVALYPFLQKHFVKGVLIGSVKE